MIMTSSESGSAQRIFRSKYNLDFNLKSRIGAGHIGELPTQTIRGEGARSRMRTKGTSDNVNSAKVAEPAPIKLTLTLKTILLAIDMMDHC